jgi:hypothetical protein
MRVTEPVRFRKGKRASCLRDCFPADDKKPVTPLPGGFCDVLEGFGGHSRLALPLQRELLFRERV